MLARQDGATRPARPGPTPGRAGREAAAERDPHREQHPCRGMTLVGARSLAGRRCRTDLWEGAVSTDVSDRPLRVVLTLLALASGLIDAASYLGLGHVFTANMTGNILLLGFATAGASGFSTSACLVSVGAFLVGEGILIAAAATVAFTVVVKAASPGAYVTIGLLAFAMGARNDTISRLSVQTNLTTTVLTSALTGLASDFALGGGSAVLATRRLTSLFSLLAGALLGATLYLHHGTALPLALAAAVELISAAVFARTAGSHILDR